MIKAAIPTITVLALLMVSCGGDSTTTGSTPTPPPPQRVKAQVTMTLDTSSDIEIMSYRPPRARMTFGLTLKETAGTGINVNYIELRCRWYGRADHQVQIGAADIIATLGTNRIEPRGTLSGSIWFIVPLQEGLSGLRVTVGMTDDLGNDVSKYAGSGSLALKAYNALAAKFTK